MIVAPPSVCRLPHGPPAAAAFRRGLVRPRSAPRALPPARFAPCRVFPRARPQATGTPPRPALQPTEALAALACATPSLHTAAFDSLVRPRQNLHRLVRPTAVSLGAFCLSVGFHAWPSALMCIGFVRPALLPAPPPLRADLQGFGCVGLQSSMRSRANDGIRQGRPRQFGGAEMGGVWFW